MSGSALYDSHALRKVEAQAAALLGGDAFELMRRAGQAAWRALLRHWPQAQRIVVACGPGNNGGDGYLLATHAQSSGRDVAVVRLPAHAPRSALARRACDDYLAAGGRIVAFEGRLAETDLIVDALFGIGLSRAPDADAAALIESIGYAGLPVFALDVPSGIDGDTGHAPGAAIRATRTLQFIAGHPGLQTGAALDRAGMLDTAALDLPAQAFSGVEARARLLDAQTLADFLPPRPNDSHKGDSGHALCIGGDAGMGGAVALCAEAALRSGAGLVSVATRAAHAAPLLVRLPEAMAVSVEDAAKLAPLLERADVVAIGPGLGRAQWGRALFDAALASGKPLVVDADALNLLAEAPRTLLDAVLTPHPGEAARLLGVKTADIQADRYAAAAALSERYGCAIVLKGAGSIIAAPGETPCVLGAGNPGMAVGGMGDALTGVVAALRAQRLSAFDAARCGALLHACAGDAAAAQGQRGLLPSDLIACLRQLANPSARHPEAPR